MASIKDVATLAGVSIATVSRYFRGTAKVSPKTAEKIARAAKDLNYIPDFFAASLKNQKSNFICFMVDNIRNTFFNVMIEELERGFSAHGYHVTLALNHQNRSVMKRNVDTYLSMRTSAFIYVPSSCMEDLYSSIRQNNTYSLQLFLDSDAQTDSVVVDDVYGTELAVDHFIKKGYTDIVMLDLANENFFNNRTKGFIGAFRKHGLTPPYENLIAISNFNDRVVDDVIDDILDSHLHPCIIAVANQVGTKVVKRVYERGLKLKKDVSLIIYDDIDLAKIMNITCISHNIGELTNGIIDTVLDGIAGKRPDDGGPVKKVFLPMLIERDSV